MEIQVKIDSNKCIGCGQCAKTCVAHNIVIQEKKAQILHDTCLFCGQCSAICPKQAIQLNGLEASFEKNPFVQLNPEQVLDVIKHRRSIRHFKDKAVEVKIVEALLEAGRYTHTAKNKQDVSYVVLDQRKDELEAVAVSMFRKLKPIQDLFNSSTKHVAIDDNFFFKEAPLVIVIKSEDKVNGILAAQNIEFLAEAYGLGVLYSGFFTMAANTSPKLKKALQLTRKNKVAMTLVIGYSSLVYPQIAPKKKANVEYL